MNDSKLGPAYNPLDLNFDKHLNGKLFHKVCFDLRLKTGLHQATLTLAEPLQGPQVNVLNCFSNTIHTQFGIILHIPKLEVANQDILCSIISNTSVSDQ